MENKTILWAAIGTLAGASLIYYLSLDNNTGIKLDSKVHKDETIKEILDEIRLEITCIYVRHYNLILRMKENKTFKPEMMSDLEAQFENERDDKVNSIINTYKGYSLGVLEQW